MSSLTYSAAWLIWVLTLPGAAPATAVRFVPDAGFLLQPAAVQTAPPARPAAAAPDREFFFSWGYNGDSYAKSDLHISQPSLGNDFTLVGVRARDSKGWPDLFNHSLTVPQYNVRFGLFFNEKWGVELAMDHIKWIVRQDQDVRITGTLNGSAVDTRVVLSADVIRYQLNNGANPIFLNLVRRLRIAGTPGRAGHVALLVKTGGGLAVPHTENTLFGQPNDKGFQLFRGWNVDAVAAVRAHLWKGLYFELEDKILYARYFDINVDRGTARHSVKANEFTFSFGYAIR